MFAEITLEADGIHNLGAELRAVGTRVQRYGPPVVRNNARDLQRAVIAHAQGRPGPEVRTGDYIRSIKVSTSGLIGSEYASQAGRISRGFEAEVYTDAPFARRLEFGFVGVDSAGRHYDQPPYPHWAPAVREVEDKFFAEMDATVTLAGVFK